MSRTFATVLADAAVDALCVVPEWVLRLALVAGAAAVTCGGPLWLSIEILKLLGGLDR